MKLGKRMLVKIMRKIDQGTWAFCTKAIPTSFSSALSTRFPIMTTMSPTIQGIKRTSPGKDFLWDTVWIIGFQGLICGVAFGARETIPILTIPQNP